MPNLSREELDLMERLPRPPLQASLRFNGVRIIEWLQDLPTEPRTGLQLHQRLEAIRPGWSKYVRCHTKNEVLKALQETEFSNGVGPVLHIECHGDGDGLGDGGNREDLLWDVLRPYLQELNEKCGCNLLVFVAACEGFAGIKSLTQGPRAPAAALIGPVSSIYSDDLAAASLEFYLGAIGGSDNLQSMARAATVRSGVHFEPEPMALLLYEALTEKLIEQARPHNRATRMKRLATRLSRTGLIESQVTARMKNFDLIEAQVAQATWDHFFLIDRFPRNAERFGLDVAALARQIASFHGRNF